MWYRTGTVTLKKGTNKVLGTNTKWLDKLSNVEAGQPLIISGNIYEITEVRSDTELYLKESALEDTTDSNYVIMSVVYGSLGDVALKASKALAHYQEQMDTFDMMYTGTQPFKVTKPDGTEIEMYPYTMLSVDLTQLNQTIQTVANYATNAMASETNAKNSATSAANSATSASNSATTAETSASAANLSATNAKTSETNAAKSATAAASSATSASTSASNAKTSETNAKNYADSINPDSFLPNKLKVIESTLDINTLKELGFYNINRSSANWPDALSGGVLQVLPLSANYITQIAYVSNTSYFRYMNNGTWGAWGKYLNANNNFSELTDKTKALENLGAVPNILTSLSVTTDLNTINKFGFYSVQPNTPNWMHASNGGVLVVMPLGANAYIHQVGFMGGNLFIRYLTTNNSWTTWFALANTSAPNTFTSTQTMIADGSNIKLKSKTKSNPVYMAFHDADDLMLAYIGRGGTNNSIAIVNKITQKDLALMDDGRLVYAGNDVLTTANSGTVNGIGSVFVASRTYPSGVGAAHVGPNLNPSLSGTWICLSCEKYDGAGITLYTSTFKKIRG